MDIGTRVGSGDAAPRKAKFYGPNDDCRASRLCLPNVFSVFNY